jgi:membrane-associated phospholipid phosphatase
MDYSDYSPWYLPQGITGHKSFPSGHAAMGWMLLPIILLIDTKNRKIRILMSVLIVSWGILVALGRVVIGAHYASDVLFSSAFGVLCYFLFSRYFRFHPPSNSKKGEKY